MPSRRLLAVAALFCLPLWSQACGDPPAPNDPPEDPDEAEWNPPPQRSCRVDDDCADDDACTWNERCEEGLCVFRIITCDDFNDCTTDTCDPAVGCVFENHTELCDDGNPCTFGDRCQEGAYLPTDVMVCDDDNPCTRDTCDPETGACVFSPESDLGNIACDDGDACTTRGRCTEGRCTYDDVECPSDTQCRRWTCDADAGCVPDDLEGPCNDGDACTTGDTCQGGACVGGPPRVCSDDDPCTDDICDPLSGCLFPHNTAPCDDGITCTASGRCDRGTCLPGPSTCDDDNPCTIDVCDAELGCQHIATAGPCDDGNPCTVGDFCADGACVPGPTDPCDDGLLCTDNVCTPNGEVPACSQTQTSSCLAERVAGDYFGLFWFGFDALAQTEDFDCLGTATASLLEGAGSGDAAVVSGSASCTWDLSLSPNRAVLVSFTARDTGARDFLLVDGVTLETRRFAGTLTTEGALTAELPVLIHVTASWGNPQILIAAEGSATAPPAVSPAPRIPHLKKQKTPLPLK